jgi:hypothetical protein
MHRGRRARLDRLSRRADDRDSAAAERYRVLAGRAAIGAAVRRSLARRGIEPSRVAALAVADEAEAELVMLGDPPPPPAAESSAWDRDLSPDPLLRLNDRLGRLAARYRGDPRTEPDLAQASLAELFAWCIAADDGTDST